MSEMNFAHFRGVVPKFQNYASVAEQNGITTTYPARYEQRAIAVCQDDDDNMDYLLHYEVVRRACAPSGGHSRLYAGAYALKLLSPIY